MNAIADLCTAYTAYTHPDQGSVFLIPFWR